MILSSILKHINISEFKLRMFPAVYDHRLNGSSVSPPVCLMTK